MTFTHARLKGKSKEHKITRFYTIDNYSCYCIEENVRDRVHEFWYPEDKLILIPHAKQEERKKPEKAGLVVA